MPFDQQATGIRMNAFDALEKKYLENTSDVERQIYLLWKKGKKFVSYKLPIAKKMEEMAMKAVGNDKLYRQIMRGEVVIEQEGDGSDVKMSPGQKMRLDYVSRDLSKTEKLLRAIEKQVDYLLGVDDPSAMDDVANKLHSIYAKIVRKKNMGESKKFRFDELFDPTGRSQSAADKYLQDRGSSLLRLDTTPSSGIDDTHETDEYKQMSDDLMKAYQMAWRNNMQLDGHTLENLARIAQQLQNMSSVAESTEIDEITEKAGIKKNGS